MAKQMLLSVPRMLGRSAILSVTIMVMSGLQQAFALDMNDGLRQYLSGATVTEAGGLSGNDQQVSNFLAFVQSNWSELLSQIEVIAPKSTSQEVIVAAAEYLPGKDYLTFLSGLLDKSAANKIDGQIAIDALSAKTVKQGFLAYNYQNQSVRALCERAKTLFPNDSNLQRLMSNILSGEQKVQSGGALAMERRAEPEILPNN